MCPSIYSEEAFDLAHLIPNMVSAATQNKNINACESSDIQLFAQAIPKPNISESLERVADRTYL